MKILKQSEVKKFRDLLYNYQNNKCEVLKVDIPNNKRVLDHIHNEHKSFYEKTGYCRGVIHSEINVLLGKIENQWLRTSKDLKDNFKLSEVLRNLADYIEKHENKSDEDIVIHPREYKEPKIMKSKYNKLKKMFEKDYIKKFPEFPKSGKLTKELKKISEEYNFSLYKD